MKPKVSRELLLFREMGVYQAFLVEAPPIDLVANPERAHELQDWVANHLKPSFQYATAISIMDAASAIPVSQIDNGGEERADQ